MGLLALEHGVQAVLEFPPGGDPRALSAEHAVVCLTGVAAAYGLWRGSRWTPPVLAIHGLAVAVLVVSLGPLLNIPPAARGGLWVGATTIVILFAAAVWYARRHCHPERSKGSAVLTLFKPAAQSDEERVTDSTDEHRAHGNCN